MNVVFWRVPRRLDRPNISDICCIYQIYLIIISKRTVGRRFRQLKALVLIRGDLEKNTTTFAFIKFRKLKTNRVNSTKQHTNSSLSTFLSNYAGLTNVGDWTWLYRSFIVVWIFFGLGYLVMVINIITRGLRSRPVLTLEKKMASRIRATRRRLAKDAKLLHNLVNEIRILNIKVSQF